MSRSLIAQRVLGDVEVLAHAGLDLDSFAEEAMDSIQRAVPSVGACMGTIDPSTHMLTSTRKFGDLRGKDHLDHEWGLIEYGRQESTSFMELATTGSPAVATGAVQRPGQERSGRVLDFIGPNLGYYDELRTTMRDRGQVWAQAALFRGIDDEPFTPEEIELVESLSTVFAVGVRCGLLTGYATAEHVAAVGPAVVIVGADDQVHQMSAGAEARLAQLATITTDQAGVVAALVGAARRFAAGASDRPPRSRVRASDGMWLVLHATPMSPRGQTHGDVVVTIDEARPPEIVPLVVAAFDLTQRERDVTQLVLQGVDTKEIAAALNVSSYTVQDHLKSVFDKADVRSRRELIAKIYFDQYVPRLGTDVGPTGWFASV